MRFFKALLTAPPLQFFAVTCAASLIAGCSGDARATAAQALAPARSCPASFPRFATKFENNAAFRMAQTKDPVAYAWIDQAGYPDGKPMQGSLSRLEVAAKQESLFPFSFADKALARAKRVSRSGSAVELLLFVPESDALQLRYTFVRSGQCWVLTRIQDLSR